MWCTCTIMWPIYMHSNCCPLITINILKALICNMPNDIALWIHHSYHNPRRIYILVSMATIESSLFVISTRKWYPWQLNQTGIHDNWIKQVSMTTESNRYPWQLNQTGIHDNWIKQVSMIISHNISMWYLHMSIEVLFDHFGWGTRSKI